MPADSDGGGAGAGDASFVGCRLDGDVGDSTMPKSDELVNIDHDPTDFDDDGLDDEDEEYYDCGMDRDGGCSLAGTEQCDWECPYEKPWEVE